MSSSSFSGLTSAAIHALCGPAAQQVVVEVVAQTGSTNADLLSRLAGTAASSVSLAPRHLLLAHAQTAGRGRAGRSWLSAPGASLTFSLAWKFPGRVQDLLGLPLAVGVIIAEALANFQVTVELKWPNDVLRQGKKLAGVLIETSAPANPLEPGVWAVIGIGLNVHMPVQLAAGIDQAAAQLSQQPLDPCLVMVSLLDGLAQGMNLFEEKGFAAFQARWNRLHAHQGKEVEILDHGRCLQQGVALGADLQGCLVLAHQGRQWVVTAGDVSLRMKEAD